MGDTEDARGLRPGEGVENTQGERLLARDCGYRPRSGDVEAWLSQLGLIAPPKMRLGQAHTQ